VRACHFSAAGYNPRCASASRALCMIRIQHTTHTRTGAPATYLHRHRHYHHSRHRHAATYIRGIPPCKSINFGSGTSGYPCGLTGRRTLPRGYGRAPIYLSIYVPIYLPTICIIYTIYMTPHEVARPPPSINQRSSLTKPHAGKREATSQHHRRGQ